MQSRETILVLRTIMTKGVLAMALLGLVACATIHYYPGLAASRSSFCAQGRGLSERLSRRAQLLSIRAVTFSTWYRAADKQSVMGSASVERDLGGRVRLLFTTNRNGQIGTLPPKCCSGSPNSDNT
jgi:hypothetical protein